MYMGFLYAKRKASKHLLRDPCYGDFLSSLESLYNRRFIGTRIICFSLRKF